MPVLKLAKLPDRTPVRLAIAVSPELHKSLHQYAELYHETYGAEESVAELVPFMLETFLDSDKRFKILTKGRHEAGTSTKGRCEATSSAAAGHAMK